MVKPIGRNSALAVVGLGFLVLFVTGIELPWQSEAAILAGASLLVLAGCYRFLLSSGGASEVAASAKSGKHVAAEYAVEQARKFEQESLDWKKRHDEKEAKVAEVFSSIEERDKSLQWYQTALTRVHTAWEREVQDNLKVWDGREAAINALFDIRAAVSPHPPIRPLGGLARIGGKPPRPTGFGLSAEERIVNVNRLLEAHFGKLFPRPTRTLEDAIEEATRSAEPVRIQLAPPPDPDAIG